MGKLKESDEEEYEENSAEETPEKQNEVFMYENFEEEDELH